MIAQCSQWFVHIVQGKTAKASKGKQPLAICTPSLTFVLGFLLKSGDVLLVSQSQTLSDLPSSKLLKQNLRKTEPKVFCPKSQQGYWIYLSFASVFFELFSFLHNNCCTFCVHGKEAMLSGCLPWKRRFSERVSLADKILVQTSLHCLSCLQTPSFQSRFRMKKNGRNIELIWVETREAGQHVNNSFSY